MGEIVSPEATLSPSWKEIRQKGDERGELTMLKGLGGGGQEQRLGESGGFAFRSPKPWKGTQCDNGVFSDF